MKIYITDNLCTTYKLGLSKLQEYLRVNGAEIVTSPKQADLVVVGLCAAFEADEKRSKKIIQSVNKIQKPIYYYGCLTKVQPFLFKGKNLFHTWELQRLAKKLIQKPIIAWKAIVTPASFRNKTEYRIYNPHKHFVAITSGCSFHCTYCPHKVGAGSFQSRKPGEIYKQIKQLVLDKSRAIIITGIDTACYGKDFSTNFASLLSGILKIVPKTMKLHIAQFNPEGLKINFKKMVRATQDKRVVDFQLPIQSTSSRILKMMNRHYNPESISQFIKTVKKVNPSILFRTDLIVGFPTETETELTDSMEFVAKNFDEVAIYGFELKKTTPLGQLKPRQFPPEEITRRVNLATKKLRDRGLLVHSGGQNINSLFKADLRKEKNEKQR